MFPSERYEGRITGWDIFNEIIHDDDYFLKLFGPNLFADMIGNYFALFLAQGNYLYYIIVAELWVNN